MKWLAIVFGVLLFAATAGALVLVQHEWRDLPSVVSEQSSETSTRETGSAAPSAASPADSSASSPESAASRQDDVAAENFEAAVAALTPQGRPGNADQRVGFDVARINPGGVSVFAGQGKPSQSVSVLADGVHLGTAKVDENGEWVLVTEKKIASADPELSIEVGVSPMASGGKAALGTEPGDAGPKGVSGPKDVSGPKGNDAKNETESSSAEARSKVAASRGSPDTPREDSASNTRVAAAVAVPAAASDRQSEKLTPRVREINERMLDDLQRLVDQAAREDADRANKGSVPPANTQVTQTNSEEAGDKTEAVEVAETPKTEKEASSAQASPPGPAVKQEHQRVAVAGKPPEPRAKATKQTVPIPIQFVYREATFTPDGEKAANLLLQYAKLGKLPVVTLSGHADERGSTALNMELSKERLKTVEKYLRSGGYKGRLILLPKGETEPYNGVERASLDAEDLFQLDRRVELHLAD